MNNQNVPPTPMGRSVLGGQWGCSRGSLDFQENCRNDREGGQVKIGHKGTKEGSQLQAPIHRIPRRLSDEQPTSAEAGSTYCTRGGCVERGGGEYLGIMLLSQIET